MPGQHATQLAARRELFIFYALRRHHFSQWWASKSTAARRRALRELWAGVSGGSPLRDGPPTQARLAAAAAPATNRRQAHARVMTALQDRWNLEGLMTLAGCSCTSSAAIVDGVAHCCGLLHEFWRYSSPAREEATFAEDRAWAEQAVREGRAPSGCEYPSTLYAVLPMPGSEKEPSFMKTNLPDGALTPGMVRLQNIGLLLNARVQLALEERTSFAITFLACLTRIYENEVVGEPGIICEGDGGAAFVAQSSASGGRLADRVEARVRASPLAHALRPPENVPEQPAKAAEAADGASSPRREWWAAATNKSSSYLMDGEDKHYAESRSTLLHLKRETHRLFRIGALGLELALPAPPSDDPDGWGMVEAEGWKEMGASTPGVDFGALCDAACLMVNAVAAEPFSSMNFTSARQLPLLLLGLGIIEGEEKRLQAAGKRQSCEHYDIPVEPGRVLLMALVLNRMKGPQRALEQLLKLEAFYSAKLSGTKPSSLETRVSRIRAVIGTLYFQLGDVREAIKHLERAIDAFDDWPYRFMRGKLYLDRGRSDPKMRKLAFLDFVSYLSRASSDEQDFAPACFELALQSACADGATGNVDDGRVFYALGRKAALRSAYLAGPDSAYFYGAVPHPHSACAYAKEVYDGSGAELRLKALFQVQAAAQRESGGGGDMSLLGTPRLPSTTPVAGGAGAAAGVTMMESARPRASRVCANCGTTDAEQELLACSRTFPYFSFPSLTSANQCPDDSSYLFGEHAHAGCRLVRYCSSRCQTADWANHRRDCIKTTGGSSAGGGGKVRKKKKKKKKKGKR